MDMKYNSDTLQNLTDVLSMSPANHVIYAAPKQKVSFEDKSSSYVYILNKRMVDIRRNSDGVIIYTTKVKTLLGLESIFTGLYFHHLTCVTESHIIAIDRLAALDLLNKKIRGKRFLLYYHKRLNTITEETHWCQAVPLTISSEIILK